MPNLKFADLKKYIASKPSDSTFILEGEDAYFREKGAEMITAAFVFAYPEINTAKLLQPSLRELAESLSMLPFLGGKRAVLVKEYYPPPSDIESLKKSLIQGGESVLIISNMQKYPSFRALEGAVICDCSKEEPAVLKNWIKSIFNTQGKEISTDAAEKLAVYCGQDMLRINGEINKLKMLEKAEITPCDIEENVSKDTDYQAYMLSSAAAEKSGKIYEMIKDFTSKGDASGAALLSSLYSSYKRMFYCKDSKLSKETLSQYLGVKPYAVTMSGKSAARYKKAELRKSMNMLSQCDYNIKSGNMEGETAVYYSIANLLKK